MKKILAALVLFSLSLSGFSQNTDSKSYDDLIRQSKKARTTAIIFVSTGPVIAAGGIGTLIYGLIQNDIGDPVYYYDVNGNYVGSGTKNYTTEIVVGAAGTLVGLGLALSSIAFSNKAHNLRAEARKVRLNTSFDRIPIPGFQNGLANGTSQYKLSLVIPLGR